MKKFDVINRLTEGGVVAVVRAENSEKAVKIAEACIEGGIKGIEVTFTVPHAEQVIADLKAAIPSEKLIVGAGTVLDAVTARIAILSGAQYVVSPYFDPETIKLCNRYRVAGMPGCTTIKEVVNAMEAGADIIKVFPGELFGPKIIKSINILPHTVLF